MGAADPRSAVFRSIAMPLARVVLGAWLATSSPAALAADDAMPRPEHPNPQLQREQWLNLNGTWEFWEGDAASEADVAARTEFPDRIVVPFCRESKLSGLARTGFVKNVVYRRTFEVPAKWSVGGASVAMPGGRLLLHVGACDWRTVIWVNGQRVGFHEGGSAPITCDVTDALKHDGTGTNEVRIWAFDDTRSKLQQCGKQSDKEESYGCVYTRTTGIWQTVWIERVGTTSIENVTTTIDFGAHGAFQFAPDPLGNMGTNTVAVHVRPRLRGEPTGLALVAAASRNGERVTHVWRPASGMGESLDFSIGDPALWSPSDPALYDLVLTLRCKRLEGRSARDLDALGDDVEPEEEWPVIVDEVHSYFGIRSIERDGLRVLLNGKPVFQRLILDQGFYPDGIWTAPSDAALKHDVEMSMAAGFNGARLHQKVFEPRFHYWADQLGYLTWGEAPSWGVDNGNPAAHRVIAQEWTEVVERDRNHPSIVGWCPFNETGGESGPLQNLVTTITRAADPTRLLLDTSGYVHSDPKRDVDDTHDYDQNPGSFRARYWPNTLAVSMPARYGSSAGFSHDRPFFVSEFGGVGWIAPGEKGWGYGGVPKTEEEWFARFKGLCDAQLDNPSLFGFCYTQLTDVEQERNGLYFYDRRPKFDVAKLHAIVARAAAIETNDAKAGEAAPPPVATAWQILVPSAIDDPGRTWMFTAREKALPDDQWRHWTLKDATSAAGRPGFGHKEGFDLVIGTPWTTPELYLFRMFDWDGKAIDHALLVMHHDNAVTLCLNGETLFERDGWNDRYEPFDVSDRLRALLKPGSNTLTVHVHQDTGGQYFDAALLASPAAPIR